mmetsp:Transcript_98290/g.175011  ORF Transcript_98290/g.175011 Transcript_98290/m.175011 type:complete len:98 (+) Transcript_98290:3-296(+)
MMRFELACEEAARGGRHEIEWDTFEVVDTKDIFEVGQEQLLVSLLGKRLEPLGFRGVSVQSIDHSWTADNGVKQRGWLNITASWPLELAIQASLDRG